MDGYRGGRSGNNPERHHNRHPGMYSRSPDNPMNHHHRNPSFRSGFSDGPYHDHDHHQPFNSPPNQPFGSSGFRPRGGEGFGSGGMMPYSGQKRSFSGKGGSPDNTDGDGSFAKLFVGAVPRTVTEEDVRPLFEKHGNVVEVALIKDKKTGQQQGCCFIKYATSEEAERAIRHLHNQYTLPGGVGPIQVRYADREQEHLGPVEHKVFVALLNKQATEKEVEEIFSPYGHVEDVYIMRDAMKQSRGCGFVKFSHRDMAAAALNALNGTYVMRGCDQPLTVRFAHPKRPRTGETRGGPTFGSPGFGPRFQAPFGVRPSQNLGDFMGGHISPLGVLDGSANGPHSGLSALPAPRSQQNFNPSFSQVQYPSQQLLPLQKSIQSPPYFPPSLQHQQTPTSFSQRQTSQATTQQLGQLQIPHSTGQLPFSQAPASQQLLGSNGQLSISQPWVEQSNSSAAAQEVPQNLQRQPISASANQQQLSGPAVQQQLLQPLQQSPTQLSQMPSQRTEAAHPSFRSPQQAITQLHQMQPSSQSLTQHQGSQDSKQQSLWTGVIPQTVASTSPALLAAVAPSTVSIAPVVPISVQPSAPLTCSWSEHTSPDGYKYYYNNVTSESRWEKPEEFTLFELQQQQKQLLQQQQVPSIQQLQSQSKTELHPQVLSTQVVSQPWQIQHQTQLHHQPQVQFQQPSLSTLTSGLVGHQSVQERGYAQLQTPAGSVVDPTRFQQGLQTAEGMWKNKPAGT